MMLKKEQFGQMSIANSAQGNSISVRSPRIALLFCLFVHAGFVLLRILSGHIPDEYGNNQA